MKASFESSKKQTTASYHSIEQRWEQAVANLYHCYYSANDIQSWLEARNAHPDTLHRLYRLKQTLIDTLAVLLAEVSTPSSESMPAEAWYNHVSKHTEQLDTVIQEGNREITALMAAYPELVAFLSDRAE